MKQCIFCGKTESDFDDKNSWSEEHIIPQSLGNKTLIINCVCKQCNDKLGSNVDNYFLDNTYIKLIRQRLNITNKSGEVPVALKKGEDKEGLKYRMDSNFNLEVIPKVELKEKSEDQTENQSEDQAKHAEVRIIANTKEEAKDIFNKKAKRMGVSDEEIQKGLSQINKSKRDCELREVGFAFKNSDNNRILMEIAKIAYEFSYYKLGEEYLKDPRAIEMRDYLKDTIDGEMRGNCRLLPGVTLIPEEVKTKFENFMNQDQYIRKHILTFGPDKDNHLIAYIFLFMNLNLSYAVIVSDNASKYEDKKDSWTSCVDV